MMFFGTAQRMAREILLVVKNVGMLFCADGDTSFFFFGFWWLDKRQSGYLFLPFLLSVQTLL